MSTATASSVNLTGGQKAALVLLQMQRDQAAKVMQQMTDDELSEIAFEIARLTNVEDQTVTVTVDEFNERLSSTVKATSGGFGKARSMLQWSVGKERADVIMNASSAPVSAPFQFLRRADPLQVLGFLSDEHPQTITLVLAHMRPEFAALVISGLDEERQRDIAHRLAVMESTPPEAVEDVHRQLERKLKSVLQASAASSAGGVQALVDILNRADRTTEKLILDGLAATDPDLAEEVRNRMFVFRDIVSLDDRTIQLVLRGVDSKELAMALKGVAPEVRDKITKNMSERAGLNLLEEIDMLGPVRMKTVEEAQAAVVRIIRSLEESGQLVLSRGGDEFVV